MPSATTKYGPMLARCVSVICEPIQSQITGLPNHSISPPSTIRTTRPVCLAVRDIRLPMIVPGMPLSGLWQNRAWRSPRA